MLRLPAAGPVLVASMGLLAALSCSCNQGPADTATDARTTATLGAAATSVGTMRAADSQSQASDASPTDAEVSDEPVEDYVGVTMQGGAIGGTYQLQEVRHAVHDAYTRLVWELDRSGDTPLYSALQVLDSDGPTSGQARIRLTLHDVYAMSTESPLEFEIADSPIAHDVSIAPIHDDSLLVFVVSLDRPARFELAALESEDEPTRIVLDVLH